MPEGLASLGLADQYRTGESSPVSGFYEPCLDHSCTYDRAVGYFRSTIYGVVGPATVRFARRGGKIRLVCSPQMQQADANSIVDGYDARGDHVASALLAEIGGLSATDEAGYRLKVLSTLVATGSLEVRLALRPSAQGVYHEKIGVFRDASGAIVTFLGSANETWNGWAYAGNHERIEVFCSWKGDSEERRVRTHVGDFDRLWAGGVPGVDVIPFPEAAKKKLIEHKLDSLNEIDLDRIDDGPGRSGAAGGGGEARTALPHQIEALQAWRAAGKRGVLEHATGSGKTFTAILAIKEHVAAGNPVLVLVPSSLLLSQWKVELEREIPGAIIQQAGDGETTWERRDRLKALTERGEAGGNPRLVLASMQTACTQRFLRGIHGGDHLMVVADEVHAAGSQGRQDLLGVSAGPRLGLSATPKRYGDPEGTQRILGFFGEVLQPPFTLQQAIAARRLVEYLYYPCRVHLTDDEQTRYRNLSEQIQRAMRRAAAEGPRPELSEQVKRLLIQRARIAKRAAGKVGLATQVVREKFKDGERWLLYCEDREQLQEVMDSLNEMHQHLFMYHSGMARDERFVTLDAWRLRGGILVSIRCLDEGIDIPEVTHALILASSQNPRQFIQRRGRVLRVSPGKSYAVIYDAMVVPSSLDDWPEQLALLKSEIARCVEFAESAMNRASLHELWDIARRLGPDNMPRLRDEGDEEESD